mgnify:CR=1 FL=1
MCVIRSLRWSFLFAIKPKIQQSYLFYIEKFQSEGGINMAVAIKRVIQFSHAKMNSLQSEQTRIRAKNKYKNDHICEEFKKFNLHSINNTEGLTYNQYFKKYCKRRTGGKKKVDVVSEMGEKDFYLDKLYTGKGGGKTTCCVESMVISLNDRIDATEEAIKAYQEDPDNQQKMDAFVTYITKSDPRFRNCRFLNVDWHFDEVYTPYEKKPPTEEFPDGEIVVGTPKISIHAHITYIPLAKDIDKNGKEYLNLNRGAIWKSRTAAYNQSYSQFNDDIYETPLMFTLRGKEYTAQCKSVAGNRISISEWFSDRGNPMKNGFYTIDVSCPIYSVLPEKIKKIFGERNRNICGQYVKFEPVGGNTIHFSYGLVLKNSKVQVIDMQQRISAL